MSNESAPECLTHKDNRNVQVRLDYILLYQSEPKAKIIRILETWTNHKYAEWYKASADHKEQEQEPPEEDLWVTMSYDQLTIFVYGTAQHDTIKQYVDELVASGDIQRRPHPEIPYGSPQYLLNRKKLQDALDALEIPPNLFDLSPFFLSPRKKHTPLEKYPPGRGKNIPRVGINLPLGTGENTHPSNKHTKKETNKHTKKESDMAAQSVSERESFANAHDALAQFDENDYHFYGTKKQHLIWNCHNWCAGQHGTCEDYVAAIENGWHETPTAPKLEAVKPPLAIASTSIPALRDGQSSPIPRSAVTPPTAEQGEHTIPVSERAGSAHPPSANPLAEAQMPAGAGPPQRPRKVQLSAHEAEMRAWLEELRGMELDLASRDITAIRSLGKKKGTDDKSMFLHVVAVLDIDPWFEKHNVAVDFYWIDYHWNNKYMFLQRKTPLADGPSSPQVVPPGWTAEDEARFVALQRQAKGV